MNKKLKTILLYIGLCMLPLSQSYAKWSIHSHKTEAFKQKIAYLEKENQQLKTAYAGVQNEIGKILEEKNKKIQDLESNIDKLKQRIDHLLFERFGFAEIISIASAKINKNGEVQLLPDEKYFITHINSLERRV